MLSKTAIVAWTVKAMASWIPIASHGGDPSIVQERYEQLASDFYDVAMSEAPLFQKDDDRLRTILLLASVESFESAFKKGMKGKRGDYCEMQIVPTPKGVVLEGDEWRYGTKGEDVITGPQLLADHVLCVRTALHMMRASFRHTRDLGEYTGEGTGGKKSGHRLKRAEWWFRNKKAELETS